MQVTLTQNQLEQIIEALEKNTDKPVNNYPLTSYLKSIKKVHSEYQPIETDFNPDDIPF